jgi:hypothetical protein
VELTNIAVKKFSAFASLKIFRGIPVEPDV